MGDRMTVVPVIVGILIISLTLPDVMGHGNVDQSFTGPYNLDLGLFPPAGQTFTPTAPNLVGVDIFLSSTAQQTRSVTVSILQGSEINSGIEIDSVTREINFPQRSSFLDFIEYHFDFDPPVPLIPGQPYGIEIDTGVQTIGSPGNNGNLYPGGGASQLGSPVGQFVDIGFRTSFGDGSGGGGGGLIPPNPDPTDTPNLNVITGNPQFPNSIFGSDVVTVQVIDSDINDTDEAKGEPDVSVNGKDIRMVQAVDGNWYGYFADVVQAQIADSNNEEGEDFGTFCSQNTTILDGDSVVKVTSTLGIAISSLDGQQGTNPPTQPITDDCAGATPLPDLLNVVKEEKDVNTNSPPGKDGQIGMNGDFWPFIQLHDLSRFGNVVVQYNKGGGAQITTLSFSESEPPEPEPKERKSGGGDDRHNTRPTHFKSWETSNVIVTESFGLGDEFFTLADNHFTHFDLQEIPTGQTIEIFFKAYADKGVWFNSLHLGVPEVGLANLAEVTIDVEHEIRTFEIIDVTINQDTEVVDENISVSSEMVKCSPDDSGKSCYGTTIKLMLRETLKSHVVAIETIDGIRQNHISFLNEGIEITGESLNPMLAKMIPSTVRYEGLLKVTQVEKYSPYWEAEDGRTFEMNSFGSFKQINHSFERFQDTGTAYTRMHSGFGGIIAYEQNRALDIFDSSNLFSELPASFAYIFPETGQRMNEEMRQEMLVQEEIAKRILDEMDKQDRHY